MQAAQRPAGAPMGVLEKAVPAAGSPPMLARCAAPSGLCSVEPILLLEIPIVRMAAITENGADEEGFCAMGRKHIMPHGLIGAHGDRPVSNATPSRAPASPRTIWRCCGTRLRTCSMTTGLPPAGNWQRACRVAFQPGDRELPEPGQKPTGSPATGDWPPARAFADHHVEIDREGMPAVTEIIGSRQ